MLYAINSAVYLQFLRTRGSGKGAAFGAPATGDKSTVNVPRAFTE